MFEMNHTFKDFDRFFLGYDKLFNKMASITDQSVKVLQKYPPFNIKKLDEDKYSIELAVAGFGRQDIDIELKNGSLIISGKTSSPEEDSNYIWKGISSKAFTRQFNIADNVEIKSAELINGMLKIWLEAITPEIKSTKIEIKEPAGYRPDHLVNKDKNND